MAKATKEKANTINIKSEPSIEMPSSSFNLVACYEKTDKQIEEGYTPVRVNEISAANDIYVNEYGKKADWVELYNTTDEDINVEGMYLSNDANNLTTLLLGISCGALYFIRKDYPAPKASKLDGVVNAVLIVFALFYGVMGVWGLIRMVG